MDKQKLSKESEDKPDGYAVLPAVNFQFLYRKNRKQEYAQEYLSKKTDLKSAMDDFLTKKQNLFDIDEEVKVTYKDGSEEFVQIYSRQDWDLSWYFVFEGEMICGDGYSCPYNGR